MITKVCFKCGETKPLYQFYKHPAMGDGHLNKCKECTKKDVGEYRSKNIEAIRKYDRERGKLEHRKENNRIYSYNHREQCNAYKRKYYNANKTRVSESRRIWVATHQEKRSAHIILNNALKAGKILRHSCAICGEFPVDAHHTDYSKPLDVVWLCKKHHGEAHRKYNQPERFLHATSATTASPAIPRIHHDGQRGCI